MKYAVPIILVAVTVGLMVLGLFTTTQAGVPVGVTKGSALHTAKATTPQQAVDNLLLDVQRRNWDRAFADVSSSSGITKQAFIQDWTGSDGSLRSFSSLEGYESRPLHATDDQAEMRVHLNFSTPVGPLEDVRDIHFIREGDVWKAVWPKVQVANVPAQVIPVTFLRWDLVTGSAGDEWGARNIDAPHVRIISMNAVDSGSGAVVMGEVTNDDTVPAFVTVNATLVGENGNPIDEESSFDKIDHILLPKQVSPYRIDFPESASEKCKKRSHGRESNVGSRLRRSSDWGHESENRNGSSGQKRSAWRLAESGRPDRQYSPRDCQLLRQQRQSDLGLRRLCRSSAAAAIFAAFRG